MLVATPFNVPRILKLAAELVSRIVMQGKAKTAHQPFMSIKATMAICRSLDVGSNDVKGAARYTNGKVNEHAFRQLRTPYLRAKGGNTRNWMHMP
jgi:hypothetical protein